MGKLTFSVAIIILSTGLFFASCKKSRDEKKLVIGLYTENTPVVGRSQLDFFSNDHLVMLAPGFSTRDTFKYVIWGSKMILTPTFIPQATGQPVDFEVIDDYTIRIQDLYPVFPELTKSFMIFKR